MFCSMLICEEAVFEGRSRPVDLFSQPGLVRNVSAASVINLFSLSSNSGQIAFG